MKNKCKKCSGGNVVMVEYDGMHPEHYDGTSETKCLDCGVRVGRWSGKELAVGEFEVRLGGK